MKTHCSICSKPYEVVHPDIESLKGYRKNCRCHEDDVIRINEEWLRYGEYDTEYISFFYPIDEAKWEEGRIYVKNRYGEYLFDHINNTVVTLSGIDKDKMDDLVKYGMGIKVWEKAP